MKLLVIAKAPVPGRVKTRLCPPCSPDQAASLAEAALADTLEAVVRADADDRVVILDGEPGDWLPPGIRVVEQRGRGLDERLAAAFEDAGGRALLIGMDTPQVTPGVLDAATARLAAGEDIIGEALDGGWWAIGLQRADPRVFLGVPMSAVDTAVQQRARMRYLGLRVGDLERLRDVDTYEDALAVATEAPRGRFAATVRSIRVPEMAP